MEHDLKFQFSGRIITTATRPDNLSELTPDNAQWLNHHQHRHDYREFLAVISGGGFFQLNDRYFQLKTGDLVLINSKAVHSDGHYPDGKSVFWWGLLWTDILRIHLWEADNITESGLISMGNFNNFICQIWDEFDQGKCEAAGQELVKIVSCLADHYLRTCHPPEQPHKEMQNTMKMDKIIRYMDQMPSLNCSLKSLAVLAGYSRIHFQRLFTEYTGMTFREYMLRKRVERYRRAVKKDNVSLKEIADELGFASESALCHWKDRIQKQYRL